MAAPRSRRAVIGRAGPRARRAAGSGSGGTLGGVKRRTAVQVELGGQVLTIRSDEGPDYVRELAATVDERLRSAAGPGRPPTSARAALLVALELADELCRAHDAHRRFCARVEQRLAALELELADHAKILGALDLEQPRAE